VNPDLQPAGSGVFAVAVQWLQGTLLGTVATAVAVIAVASVGVLLLSGRIDVRRGAQVIFGCFILFGASSIAAGITRAAESDGTSPQIIPPPPPPVYAAPAAKAQVKSVPYDPYAGAALPTRP
jgi:type IV secretory pathway VirB2 component (pilin)